MGPINTSKRATEVASATIMVKFELACIATLETPDYTDYLKDVTDEYK